MGVPPPIVDHVDRALAELLSKFAEAVRLRRLVTVEVTQVQEAEDAGEQLLTDRLLENAEGVQLDIYGKIVGGPAEWRGALTDADFLKVIEIAISVNQSDGRIEDGEAGLGGLSIIAALVGVKVRYSQHNPAHYRLEWITATPVSADMLQRINELMPRITVSGVSWSLIEAPVGPFQLDVANLDIGKLARRVDDG
jgi:hypothetical protein